MKPKWDKIKLEDYRKDSCLNEAWYKKHFIGEFPKLEDGIPCSPGCLNHRTHPCEECGRIGARKESNGN